MKSLQIDETKARQLYPAASPEMQSILEDSFGKEFFSLKITDRVKSYQDACEVLGISESPVTIANIQSKDANSIVAYAQLAVIARALNEGWEPDWTDSSQRKYIPWFEHKPGSGFGLSYDDCADWRTVTTVGSRLCYKTAELAKYAATQFAELYDKFLTIK